MDSVQAGPAGSPVAVPIETTDERPTGWIRVRAAERAVITAAAALAGLTVPAYVRGAVVDRALRDLAAADPEDDAADGVQTGEIWSASWELAHGEAAAGRARALTRMVLEGWGLGELADTGTVLVSELVTNAVRHGATTPILLSLVADRGAAAGREMVCGVADGNAAPPRPRDAGLDDENGRGLALVAALAAACGWYPAGRGKVVWFAQLIGTGDRIEGLGPAAPGFPLLSGPPHRLLNGRAV